LRSYVNDYLKEEIAAEGLVRNLPAFSGFLAAAALSDGELVNFANVARECGVSGPTVREHFQILVDTLLGRFLAAYTKRPKRRVIQAPKFYFADVGVVNHLARRGRLEPGSELFGKAFESWVHHELQAYRAYHDFGFELAFWRVASGIEVDFVVDDVRVAIEAKASAQVHDGHLRGLREIGREHPQVVRRIVVSLDARARRTQDGIEILPARTFAERLWAGDLIEG
jgi:predicted AAA+ superfamily ATPase